MIRDFISWANWNPQLLLKHEERKFNVTKCPKTCEEAKLKSNKRFLTKLKSQLIAENFINFYNAHHLKSIKRDYISLITKGKKKNK